MPKLNKSQTVYVAARDKGRTHEQALALVSAGPMARSRWVTWRNFKTWADEWNRAH